MFAKCVVLVFAALFFAQGMAGPPNVGAGVAVPGVNSTPDLSRDALRQCLQQEVWLGTALEELKEGRTSRDAAVKALDVKEANIKSTGAKLDRANQKSVDTYNALVKAHRQRIAVHNQSLLALNAKASAYQTNLSRYQSSCAGKSYSESDRAAVQVSKP